MIIVRGIYDPDLNFIDIIADPVEPSFQEVLNDPGTASFKCYSADAAVQRQGWQSLLAYGNIVVMRDTDTNHYFPWVIEQRKRTTVAAGENAEQLQWTISGRGASCLLQQGEVYPEYGIQRASSDQRNFNFGSKPGVWYNSAEWHDAFESRWSTDVARARQPRGWPDPGAYWIWSSDPTVSAPLGIVFFRGAFTLDAPARVGFWATADNEFMLYVDSELVMSGKSWHTYQRFDVDLAAGTHYVGIKGTNDPTRTGSGLNPGGVLLTAWTINPSTEKRDTFIVHTNSTWKYRTSAGGPPGWDPGDLMSTLVLEAKARGVDALQHFNVNVTPNNDSAGLAWQPENLVDRSFDIGADLLDVMTQLSETSCDFRMRWDESMALIGDKDHMLRLEVFRHWGVDRSVHDPTHGDPVMLKPGFNAVEASYDGDASGIHTALLIRTTDGWIEEVNTGLGLRRREGFLSLGSSSSDTHALSVANATFALAGVPQETFGVKVVSTNGHVPFHDFGVGDNVLGLDEDSNMTSWRIASITATQDTDGNIFYVPQLNDIRRAQVKRMARWLKSMAKGTAGGRITNASPPISLAPEQNSPNFVEIPFSFSGTLSVSTSPPYTPWVDQTLVEVVAVLGTAGSSETVLTAYRNGVSLGTITVAAGETIGVGQFDDDFAANSDKLSMGCTTAGTGALDLTVQARLH